jgi:hypothetical protein
VSPPLGLMPKSRVGSGFFRKKGVGLTDKGEIADEFCKSYLQVGPKLAARIRKEREGAFQDYMRDRVGSLFSGD